MDALAHQDARWMIYGANGYTGRLCAEEAVSRGMHPVLAGRTEAAVREVAEPLGLEYRVFALDDEEGVARNLEGIAAVLHCAGPFSATARPMLAGCIKAGVHYLDITGEIDVFEYVHGNPALWREAKIAALPGVGFDVVPTDCLAAMLHRELPDATHLLLAFRSKRGKLSPGTAKTVTEGMTKGCYVRQDGDLVRIPSASRRRMIPFGDGEGTAVVIPWGDVSTAFHATGIPNIEVYLGAPEKQIRSMESANRFVWLLKISPVQRLVKWHIGRTVRGPSSDARAKDEVQLYGEATNAAGQRAARTMRTCEAYTLTVHAAVEAASRTAAGHVPPGAHTPSTAFGADFVLDLPGVEVHPAS